MDAEQLEKFWEEVIRQPLPTVVVDVHLTYDRILHDIQRRPYNPFKESAPFKAAFNGATVRTTLVFVGEANKHLPVQDRVTICDDDSNLIEKFDRAIIALGLQASRYNAVITHDTWTVWAGRPAVIKAWEDKMK